MSPGFQHGWGLHDCPAALCSLPALTALQLDSQADVYRWPAGFAQATELQQLLVRCGWVQRWNGVGQAGRLHLVSEQQHNLLLAFMCRDCGVHGLSAGIGALQSLTSIELSAGPAHWEDEEDFLLLPSSMSLVSQLERLTVQASFERTEAEQLDHITCCTALTLLSLTCPPSAMPLRNSQALHCLSALQRLKASPAAALNGALPLVRPRAISHRAASQLCLARHFGCRCCSLLTSGWRACRRLSGLCLLSSI